MNVSVPPSQKPAPSGARPRRRFWRVLVRLVYLSIGLAMLAVVCGALAGYLAYDYITRPREGGVAVRVQIPAGATGKDVAQLLAAKGLVEHEWLMRAAMRLSPAPVVVRHGAYDLPRGWSPNQLIERLNAGPISVLAPDEVPDELKLVVPEGMTLRQMAALFDAPAAFLEAARDAELLAALGVEAESLEGFLMPNTYYFDEPPAPADAVRRMVRQFQLEYERLLETFPAAAERDLLEVVTIASLIEREARVEEERPLVSAVIHNRLERGMRLDMDATLQYALNKYGQRLLDEDKAAPSPYNTYRVAGLPPGPIANPGVASLRAALQPAEMDYLYFVSNADGNTHTFSRTIAEHNRAVARYRREISVQRREQASRVADKQEEVTE